LVPLAPNLRRIALPEGIFIDFTLKRAPSLEKDLIQRDFTINALALDLDHLNLPFLYLIDPKTGLEDLINKKIKLLKKESLEKDPLRMLRAFRLASQLNFTVDDEIADFIADKSFLIKEVAKERIRDELFLLLENPSSYMYLENSSAKTLLAQIFRQNPHLQNLKELEKMLLGKGIIGKDLKKKIELHLAEKNNEKQRREFRYYIISDRGWKGDGGNLATFPYHSFTSRELR